MKQIIFTLLTLAVFQLSQAQKVCKPLIDSLYSELPKMKDDTNKVRALATICFEMRFVNVQMGLKPGIEAFNLASNLDDQFGKGLSHIALANCYGSLSNLPEEIDHYLKASSIFETLMENNLLCYSYLGLASAYDRLDSTVARKYLARAIALLPKITSVRWKVRNNGNLGNIYRSMGQLDSAIKYISISQKLSEQNHLPFEIMLAKTRLGLFCHWDCDPEKLDSDFELTKTALEYFKAVGATRLVAENSGTLSEIRIGQLQGQGPLHKQYLVDALFYAKESLKSAEEIIYLSHIVQANFQLFRIYRIEGRYEKAMEHLWTAYIINDSINGTKIINKASILSWKYEQELKEQQLELLKYKNRLQFTLMLVSFAGVALLLIVVILIIRSRKKLNKAYLLVNQQKEEISRVLGELEVTNLKLESANQELAAANQELEAFSYSVSHDLRAPVRRIEGLSNMLKEDYEKVLDDAGRDILTRIVESTQLGNRLIEDMLKLSRITRQTVTRSSCNLSEMASKVCEDLKLTYPDKDVACGIEEGIFMEADSSLLQIALQNLIDNAFKYSSKAEHPEVTIGTEIQENRKVFFIRDNGVGFDMKQADKLFTPFQRLHGDEQYKGTGIGLATVKRIIVKHGGSIRAESEHGKGTVFFFTLG